MLEGCASCFSGVFAHGLYKAYRLAVRALERFLRPVSTLGAKKLSTGILRGSVILAQTELTSTEYVVDCGYIIQENKE